MADSLRREQIKGLEFGRPLDTTPDAWEVYWRSLRSFSEERRLEMVFELGNFARTVCEQSVRQQHPEYNEEQVNRTVLRRLQGQDIHRMVYPPEDVP